MFETSEPRKESVLPAPFSNIPEEIRNLPSWVNYVIEVGEKGRKRKTPYQPNGKYASVTDPATWSSFSEVMNTVDKFDGIGFVFTDEAPYVGIDFDKCRDAETGKLEDWAQSEVDALASYTEVSPSRTGLHVIVRAASFNERGRKDKQLEIYSSKRYFTMTGHVQDSQSSTIENRDSELNRLYAKYFGDDVSNPHRPKSRNEGRSSAPELRPYAKLPPAVNDSINRDEILQGLWSMEKPLKGQSDESHSGYGFVLVGRLALRGHSHQECLDALAAFRQNAQAASRPESWYLSEIKRAFEWAEQARSRSYSSVSNQLTSAFGHWKLHWTHGSPLLPIDLFLLMQLVQISDNGDSVRISNSNLSSGLGLSERYVSARLSQMINEGCLVEIQKSRRGEPRKLRINFGHLLINEFPSTTFEPVESSVMA